MTAGPVTPRTVTTADLRYTGNPRSERAQYWELVTVFIMVDDG